MREQQVGFTLIEITIALVILGTVFAFSFRALGGVDEAAKLRGLAAQAQSLANYMDRVRLAPSSITVGSPVYPGGAPNTFTYLNLPAGSTVPDFRAAYLAEFGVDAEPTPSESPFDTPYLITITPEIAFVETTVGFNDVNIPGAESIVDAGSTTFRFYPRLKGGVRGNAQSARSAFQRNFMGESVR